MGVINCTVAFLCRKVLIFKKLRDCVLDKSGLKFKHILKEELQNQSKCGDSKNSPKYV